MAGLTDAQVDAIFIADTRELGCHWLEGEHYPFHRCGAKVDDLSQAYCKDHRRDERKKKSKIKKAEQELARLIKEQEADMGDDEESVLEESGVDLDR